MQLNQLSTTNVHNYIDLGGNSFIVASPNVKQKGQQNNNDHVM